MYLGYFCFDILEFAKKWHVETLDPVFDMKDRSGSDEQGDTKTPFTLNLFDFSIKFKLYAKTSSFLILQTGF